MSLHLTLTDYLDPTRWRWVLSDAAGRFLADHDVHLDPASREYQGFCDLRDYVDYYAPIQDVEARLASLGAWVGERVFGGLRDALRRACHPPATPVQVTLPAQANALLLRPFELACFADGTRFDRAGVRFIYHLEGTPAHACPPPTDAAGILPVRILAAFSLPVRANPLNLRRERYGLQCLARELRQTQGRAVVLRVLHYGATRETLRAALEEAPGWDIIHLSGHGAEGTLLLEDEFGGNDTIDAADLGDLLELTAERLKLLILDACYSGAGSHAAARRALGLDPAPTRQEGAEGAEVPPTAPTVLPGLAQTLSARLGCAALAMRYPVDDAFATDLMLVLYAKLLDKGRPLPAALHLALDDALRAAARPSLSPFTPLLVGAPAAALALTPPPYRPRASPCRRPGWASPSRPNRRALWAACNRSCAPARPSPRAATGAACSSMGCPAPARRPARWNWPTATPKAVSRATSGIAPLKKGPTLPVNCSTSSSKSSANSTRPAWG
ncbi:MAG TPA: CHAT domain-containing protein [Anaerolineae bacterium]|nr:CHAT domain-containing protein [Anaerolineae bacterium]HQI86017.1 CHAT domain-containing protein [Anaerolineae bacterium]